MNKPISGTIRRAIARPVVAAFLVLASLSACQKHQCPTYMTEEEVKEAHKSAMKKNKRSSSRKVSLKARR